MDMRPLTPEQRRQLGMPATLTPPVAEPAPSDDDDPSVEETTRGWTPPRAGDPFEVLWYAALAVLAAVALAAVLAAGWWPQ